MQLEPHTRPAAPSIPRSSCTFARAGGSCDGAIGNDLVGAMWREQSRQFPEVDIFLRRNIMRRFLALLLAFQFFGPSAQAQSLRFGCSGTLTSSQAPAEGKETAPLQNMVDLSVIVDLDRRAVLGFWLDVNGLPDPIPITAA